MICSVMFCVSLFYVVRLLIEILYFCVIDYVVFFVIIICCCGWLEVGNVVVFIDFVLVFFGCFVGCLVNGFVIVFVLMGLVLIGFELIVFFVMWCGNVMIVLGFNGVFGLMVL